MNLNRAIRASRLLTNGKEEKVAKNWAVVTGGTRGIGREISLELLKNGCGVYAVYKEREDEARKLIVDALKSNPLAPLKICRVDVSQREEVKKFFDGINEERVIALVNNAALQRPKDDSHEESLKVFAANVLGPHYLMQAFADWRHERGLTKEVGAIVNIGTTSAVRTPSGSVIYAASKAAFHRLSVMLTPKFASEYNLRVNLVVPGIIDTGLIPEERMKKYRLETPTKRITEYFETAKIVSWLIKNRELNIAGAAIAIDGGRML
ncbi:MAG: SDR family oxidoreductase [Parcubacteria group bacterium]|nr:SDR family oxidoreductase [Parcubacteria group bacterium]